MAPDFDFGNFTIESLAWAEIKSEPMASSSDIGNFTLQCVTSRGDSL